MPNDYQISPLCLDYAFKSIFMVHKDLLKQLIKDTLGYKLDNLKLEMTEIPNKRPYIIIH